MKKYVKSILEYLKSPLTFLAARWLKYIMKGQYAPKPSEKILMNVGILPVLDHYYQPLINPKKYLTRSLRDDRELPGINFNVEGQLKQLDKFDYNEELLLFPIEKSEKLEFFYNNGAFASGDAEYLYNMVRFYKPAKIIEVGSGNSTLMVKNAIEYNKKEKENYSCEHICIEPYEFPWLEQIGVEVIRNKIEEVDQSLFGSLGENDIFFIDSSHIIRPQGDVLLEYLSILPKLNKGVLVHIHDIFSPKDYLDEWVFNHILWNEQYLLEAFMSFNNDFKIIGALNFLNHNYNDKLSGKCPILANQKYREPGSFWIIRN